MIHVFRKEMKKWHSVLWIVFVSMALSGVSFFVFRQKHFSEMSVATVNGYPIYFDAYRRSLAEIQGRLDQLRPLAQAYGMSEDAFFSVFFGGMRPEEIAFDTCVNEALLNSVKDSFNINLDSAWFGEALAKTMPQFADESGKINMEMYQRYLQRMSTTSAEYEKSKKEEFKRDAINSIISNAGYVPQFVAEDIVSAEHGHKSFVVATFSLSHFQNIVNKEVVDEKKLAEYYQIHKEGYRIPEKRKARYWTVSTDLYVEKADVDQAQVKQYYERHKSTQFRVAPKVKVRRIFIKHAPDAKELANSVHAQVTKTPSVFAELAQKHSQDTVSSGKGGVVDFFAKGTHDKEFEQVAFRLKENGDISSVTKTAQGYEIVQLVDRVKAGEKSFDDVKEEIIKGMRLRRAASSIRTDLESVVRGAAEDATLLERFVKKHDLKEVETDWLEAQDGKEASVDGMLAKKIFTAGKREKSVGFFNFEDKYVVYQCVGVEKSQIPAFAHVKDKVLERHRSEEADALARNTLKGIRVNVLDKKMSFEDAVLEHGGKLVTTKSATKAGSAKELAWLDAGMREKLFALTDTNQVFEHKHKDEYFLAVLKEMSGPEGSDLETKCAQIIKQEKFKVQKAQSSAFIASLHRNAKIDTDRRILDGKSTDMKDE